MLVESTNAQYYAITKRPQHLAYQWPILIWALTVSSDIELAGSASVDFEPANVATSSGQRPLLDVLKPVSKSDLSIGKEE